MTAQKSAPKASQAQSAKKRSGSRKTVPAAASALYLKKDDYKACIDGLRDQGLEHKDAVDTLRLGLREANGRPVPPDLRMQQSMTAPTPYIAA